MHYLKLLFIARAQRNAAKLAENSVVTLVRRVDSLVQLLSEAHYHLLLYCIPQKTENLASELTSILKCQPGLSIVLLNGEPKQEMIIEACKLGICDYFLKPIDTELKIERPGAISHKISLADFFELIGPDFTLADIIIELRDSAS